MSIESLQVTRGSRASIVAMCLGAIVLAILVAAPWWAGRADMRLMGEIFLYLSLAVSSTPTFIFLRSGYHLD